MHPDNTKPKQQIEWTAKLGEPVKFIDEQAVLEAHQQGTCFPIVYYGRLIDVIRLYSKCIPYAQIKPFWDAPDKFIPLSNVLLPDNTTPHIVAFFLPAHRPEKQKPTPPIPDHRPCISLRYFTALFGYAKLTGLFFYSIHPNIYRHHIPYR